ncbi:hypothetical protein [Aeromonas dhakensis]|uniref:hypothetical protein n=1 Tax=Aeromonas dhakensis TaxID=196024 RepID=UPI003F74363E
MIPTSKEYILILGPIVAAIIAGGISFIITVLSKDQKTSEFRQSWIDSFREEISELLAMIHAILVIVEQKKKDRESPERFKEFLYSKQDYFVKINSLVTRIELRLNPTEHLNFIDMLKKLESNSNDISYDDSKKLIDEIVIESQGILRKEWARVKSGELSFRFIKWLSLVIFIISSVGAALYLGEHIIITYVP